MSEDHSKYMPHHPKPKFADGGKPKLSDPMLRKRREQTSHNGSGDADGSGYPMELAAAGLARQQGIPVQ